VRLFVALPIAADDVVARAAEVQRQWSRLKGIRWVAPHQLHFTLKFLGEVPEQRLAAAKGALESVKAGAFAITLAGLGTFPPGRPARVVWVGCAAGGEQLVALAQRVEQAFAAAGFPVEQRPFKPHLTLGRVKDEREARSVSRAVEENPGALLGTLTAAEIVLFQSVLSPAGPTHTALIRRSLGVDVP